MNDPATVVVQDLTKRYGAQEVLDRVELRVGPGVTGLLGPNGAGKTTLLRIVATVIRADRGTVRVFGLDPLARDERHAIRCRLGYQPQEPGFFQGFTVTSFIDYVAILKEITDRRTRRAEVRRVIELAGLDECANKTIRRLSGGMRRRVAFAQALLGRPDLLLLDEPTAGVDPEQRLRFREIVTRVAEHRTVLLSTHQTEDVAALCERVVVLHEGRARFTGSPAELAGVAEGRVWLTDHPVVGAHVSWRTGDGRHRSIGDAPPGGEPCPPTIEDGYLCLVGAGANTGAEVSA
jgi:ABC-2 type transport system ATP-binding protein